MSSTAPSASWRDNRLREKPRPECRQDLRAQLGWLDGRLVAGDDSVVVPLVAKAGELWRTNAARWLPVLAAHVDERHGAQGDVAFLLEPDLKESDRKSTRLNSSHRRLSRMPSSA